MNQNLIFYPLLAQILLVVVLYALLAVRKQRALGAGAVDRQRAALDNRAWPEDVVKVSNSIANQFELPVLFLVLCVVLHQLQAVTMAILVLAWLFVVSRFFHAGVQVTSNVVRVRLRLFMVGFVIVVAMMIIAAWQLPAGLS